MKANLSDVRIILEGFDKGIFVRNTDDDHNSDWAIRFSRYILALGRLHVALTVPANGVGCDREHEPTDLFDAVCRLDNLTDWLSKDFPDSARELDEVSLGLKGEILIALAVSAPPEE